MIKRLILNLVALAALILLCAPANAAQPQININTATLAQLELLPGVGPAMAARIIAGRPYAAPTDLARVKGLGGDGKRLALIRPYVATSGATTLTAKVASPKKHRRLAAPPHALLARRSGVDSPRSGGWLGAVRAERNGRGVHLERTLHSSQLTTDNSQLATRYPRRLTPLLNASTAQTSRPADVRLEILSDPAGPATTCPASARGVCGEGEKNEHGPVGTVRAPSRACRSRR
jgi:hypothetical protein